VIYAWFTIEPIPGFIPGDFIHAYEGIKGFNEKYRFYTWLYRIAINLCINFWEKEEISAIGANRKRQTYADPNPTVDPATRDLRRAVEKRLAQLPEEQKTVFVLRTFEEMSYQDIAETLEFHCTVMSRLSRAREKLKELLKDYMPNNQKLTSNI